MEEIFLSNVKFKSPYGNTIEINLTSNYPLGMLIIAWKEEMDRIVNKKK